MVLLFRYRMVRRSTTLLGAVCTSALVGLFLFNKFVLNGATCVASCATAKYMSYERLQRNEVEKKMKHPVVKSFSVNFLGSNSPIEDRFVAGISQRLGSALFSMIDGHKGYRCSSFLQRYILQYIAMRLHAESKLQGEHDLKILLDMNSTLTEQSTEWQISPAEVSNLPPLVVEQCLQEAFISLDNDISQQALADIKLVRQGHSFTADMKERVMRAIEGACALTALVQEKSVVVATTGDCRVVLGQKQSDSTWKAIPLSTDQNAQNPLEVERIKAAHPSEKDTVIFGDRVLGSLMPFRSFGDVDFKWEREYLEGIVPIWPNYRTPPYITAEPVLTHHTLETGDRFMIIATDGLWERISSEEAVNVVVDSIRNNEQEMSTFTSITSFFRKKKDNQCCGENVATKLLWQALGGTDQQVTELLNISPRWSRMYRDDITVMVVFFNSNE